jgi:ribosomal protein L24E
MRYTLEQTVFLSDIYVIYASARKCQRKFRYERVPRRQTIHNLMNKLKSTELLVDKK